MTRLGERCLVSILLAIAALVAGCAGSSLPALRTSADIPLPGNPTRFEGQSFDPTNNVIAGARHIRVAIGRDYQDVPPTRGVFRGEAASDLAVRVTVSLDARAISRDSPPLRWVAAEPEESRQTADQAQQQQQQ